MQLLSITTESPYYAQVEGLLLSAFPASERRNTALQREYADCNPKFEVYAALEGEKFVGFFTLWTLGEFRFVEHLAIVPECRNYGYGTRLVQQIKELSPLPLLLEIERGATAEQLARKDFYERSGFFALDIPYQQPPYEAGGEALEMHLMMWDAEAGKCHNFSPKIVEKMIEIIYSEVYGIKWGFRKVVIRFKSVIYKTTIVLRKTKPLVVKIISNLRKIISNVI